MQRVALNDLEAVLAVARRGSFRTAAIDLGISTTALSHAIARLEASLEVPTAALPRPRTRPR